jgi:hypothetical protein
MSAQRKCGQTIRSKERNIIANVIKICGGEAQQKYLSASVAMPIERASNYCNTSISPGTVGRIRTEVKKLRNGWRTWGEGNLQHLGEHGKVQ